MRARLALPGLALWLPAVAGGQEVAQVDLEMVRPGLSPQGGFGVDAPDGGVKGTWSAGALIQYEWEPLRLYDGEDLLGPLVAHRMAFQLHGGIAVSHRTSLSLMLPVGVHFGAGDVREAADSAGLGDAALTLRVRTGPWGRFSLGVLGTLLLPTGTGNAYMSERYPRLRAGLLGHTSLGRVALLTNLLAHVREEVDTVYDFHAGSELQVELGVQVDAVPHRLTVLAELITRIGLSTSLHGGRVASEALVGVRYHTGSGLRVDAGLGRGLTAGYGTTGIRAMLGLAYVHPPRLQDPEPEPEPLLVEEEILPEAEDPPPPPPPPVLPPAPVEVPVAALQGVEIVVREVIEFEVGTPTIREESGWILDAVADIIVSEPAIGHVVVEGHASREGDFAYNYELSLERARSIYEALVLRGVHPKRMSVRGAGEVEGEADAEDVHGLQADRRVVFSVVRTYAPGEERPSLGDEVVLPWTGEPHPVRSVEPPPVEPPPATPDEASAAPVEEASPVASPVVEERAAPEPVPEFEEPPEDDVILPERAP